MTESFPIPHNPSINHPSAGLSTLLRNLFVYGTASGQMHDTSLHAGVVQDASEQEGIFMRCARTLAYRAL